MIEAMGDGDMGAFHLFYQDTARPACTALYPVHPDQELEEAEDVM